MKTTKQNTTTKTPLLEEACGAHKAPLLGRGWGRPLFLLLFIISFSTANAQVGIGTTSPEADAILELKDANKALLLTRVASVSDIATPINGMIVYDLFSSCIRGYENNAWSDCLNGNPAPECLTTTTEVVDLVSPTGKTWMDRNLGAHRAATSSTDELGYGDYYQFGRRTDGHQCRHSATTTQISTTAQVQPPDTDKYITQINWYNPVSELADFWKEDGNGVNDVVCPTGYRLPLKAEWDAELALWGPDMAADAFDNLKLPLAGIRSIISSNMIDVGTIGYYHSGTANSGVRSLKFDSTTAGTINATFGNGRSVRCIKN